eukprot:CAMPEP_0197735918 /NCGR_PEP_ID=MMETSP1435-20131217/1246_1 /TAXON_ID=426625 /ORGANISM="Chaetoceros brevis, Strain CCMP164" /LENGTH=118 /DNA_ID=CAMNT_0043323869 /DNA_START=127 /DNA_END=482 /DNA_ORIENTATION=-
MAFVGTSDYMSNFKSDASARSGERQPINVKSDAQYLLGEMVVTACSMDGGDIEGPARRGGLGRRPPGGDPRLSVLQRQKLKAEPHEKVVVVEWVIQYFPVVVGSAPIVIVRSKQVKRL